jgi:FIMAH domain-containing protein
MMKRMNRLISTFVCAVAILIWTCAPVQAEFKGDLKRDYPVTVEFVANPGNAGTTAAAASPAMAGFTAGPSVRLLPPTVSIPYGKVEIRWSANFLGDGKVEVFDNPSGTGTPVDTKVGISMALDQTIEFNVGGLVQADTTSYFKVTHHDPTNNRSDETNGPAPFPPFFTGVQAIGDVNVDAPGRLARIQWDANVIGTGRVEYGINAANEMSVDDQANVTSHSLELTGLALGTTYQYRVCNRHAIDGVCLAVKTGSFTTALGNFTAGPSVRLLPPTACIPYSRVEIRWSANFGGDGKVEAFDNPDGTGTPVNTKVGASPSTEHTIEFNVGGAVQADTTYYFKVTHHDPNNNVPDETNGPAPFPPFFTGAQAIGNVFVDPGVDRARIQWDANVIGTGRVEYGINSPNEMSVDDQANVTSHNIELTGLGPGTTYQYRVSNRHAIDGGSLAAKTGSFTTLALPPHVVQTIDTLRERVASYGLPRGTARSLDAKLEAALAAWQRGDTADACSSLTAFLNEVRAQVGHKLSEAQAQQLTAAANDIRAVIGC